MGYIGDLLRKAVRVNLECKMKLRCEECRALFCCPGPSHLLDGSIMGDAQRSCTAFTR